jgi:predicted DNA binding CopG/RHH family protein
MSMRLCASCPQSAVLVLTINTLINNTYMKKLLKQTSADPVYDDAFFSEVEEDIEQGLYTRERSDQKTLVQIKKAVHNTLAKNTTVNFRVNKFALSKFKARAAEQGLPYQTLLSSLVHTYSR